MDMSLFTSFEGRINRQKWWLGLIVLMVVQWIFYIVIGMIFGGGMMVGMDPENPESVSRAMSALMIPLFILILIFLWPTLAIYAKRWHDRDKSGWWSLIILIPLIGPIWVLVELGFLRGNEGPNQYGPDPLAE
jgi:uncharacterized membrane protein YhaH (DUF805 family)